MLLGREREMTFKKKIQSQEMKLGGWRSRNDIEEYKCKYGQWKRKGYAKDMKVVKGRVQSRDKRGERGDGGGNSSGMRPTFILQRKRKKEGTSRNENEGRGKAHTGTRR